MRVLLDECLPKRLATELSGHEVLTVPEAGWAGIKNGKLLSLIAKHFDVFITIDSNLRYQQRLQKVAFAVIILHAYSNKIEAIRPLIPAILGNLKSINPGNIIHVA
jgi:hypothetical protein